jgi:hypothetical protein
MDWIRLDCLRELLETGNRKIRKQAAAVILMLAELVELIWQCWDNEIARKCWRSSQSRRSTRCGLILSGLLTSSVVDG